MPILGRIVQVRCLVDDQAHFQRACEFQVVVLGDRAQDSHPLLHVAVVEVDQVALGDTQGVVPVCRPSRRGGAGSRSMTGCGCGWRITGVTSLT